MTPQSKTPANNAASDKDLIERYKEAYQKLELILAGALDELYDKETGNLLGLRFEAYNTLIPIGMNIFQEQLERLKIACEFNWSPQHIG